MQLDIPPYLPSELKRRAICYPGRWNLAGCIGTVEPTQESLAEEIMANAMPPAGGSRFPRWREGELPNLPIQWMSGSLEPIDRREELDPSKYGVIVRSKAAHGLLLPKLELQQPPARWK